MDNETQNDKKDVVKAKVILFVIGVLVGAVISTAAFFVYTKTLGADSGTGTGNSSHQMPGGTPPEMPSGDDSENDQSGTPPEKPDDSSSSNKNSDDNSNSDNN